MQIAICDDESLFRTELKNKLLDYKSEKRIAVDITEFENGNQLLSSDLIFDMIFIDYQMPGIDGLETSKILRKKKCTCSIVFVTNYPRFMIDSFEVQPFRFLIKPIDPSILTRALDDYIKQQRLLNPIIIVELGERITINSESIIYLEGDGKYCLIRTNEHTFKSTKTISQIQMLLPNHCFYRIHKSYLVNMYCIVSLSGNEVLLINGEKAIVARSHISDFKKAYRNFVKNYYVRL